jgi:hypothetical protein
MNYKLVIASENDTDYDVGVKYIKIDYTDTKNPPNKIPSKDIMFSKTTDFIYQKRADHFNIANLTEPFSKDTL